MRLIDADTLTDKVEEMRTKYGSCYAIRNSDIIGAPTIDAAPLIPGKWVEHEPRENQTCRRIECSNCGKLHIVSNNVPYCDWCRGRYYCAVCGARMETEIK